MRRAYYSKWKEAAEGLQRRIMGMHQRTQWKFRSVRKNGAAVLLEMTDEDKSFGTIQFSGKLEPNAIAIDELIQTAPAAVLNSMLRSETPEQAKRVAPTMAGFLLLGTSGKTQNNLLNLLTDVRNHEIDLDNRIDLIRAIQKCMGKSVGNKRKFQTASANIFLQTFGADLTALKEGIGAIQSPELLLAPGTDALEHVGDLTHLVYGNKNIVEHVEVLQHFAVQAADCERSIRVISDIDDTLYPGWFDKRYPLHMLYPGVSQLFQMISNRSPVAEPTVSKGITFITARPRGWLSLGKNFTSRHLVKLGIPSPTVLPGAVKGLTSNRNIAELKFENFRKYATIYPEYDCVFFGDSSQGDALLGTKLLKSFPDRVKGVFIHDVNPESLTTGDGGEKKAYQRQGLVFYSTYVGAGLVAYEKGLIAPVDLKELIDVSREALMTAPFKSEEERELREQELEQDVQRVNLKLVN